MPASTARDLTGQVVLITGAARGIGAETARMLARRGARVALLGLEPVELAEVARECGEDAMSIVADVTDVESLQRGVGAVCERWGGIDAVVANAGIGSAGMVRSIDPASFERVIEVNLLGVWRTVRACLPSVISRRGYILVVASLAAVGHAPGMASYCASKAGAEAFANSLRAEVRHLGVDVGVAYFSWISTDLVAASDEHPVFGGLRRGAKGPMGRTYPVSQAAQSIVRGIEGRSRGVFTPGWIRILLPLRGLLPRLTEAGAGGRVAEVDAQALADVQRRGAIASAMVGPGGEAALHAQQGRAAATSHAEHSPEQEVGL